MNWLSSRSIQDSPSGVDIERTNQEGFIYLALGFIVFFGLRLIYGYLIPENVLPPSNQSNDDRSINFEFSKKNYASDKMKFAGINSVPLSVDQKYEKVGSLLSQTAAFDDDERKIRDLIKKYNAQVQFERSSGLPGNKSLNLAIGVQPTQFDRMITELKGVSSLLSIEINKTD